MCPADTEAKSSPSYFRRPPRTTRTAAPSDCLSRSSLIKELVGVAGRMVTASVGTACPSPKDRPTTASLIKSDNEALHAAKTAGRNQVATNANPSNDEAA